MWVDECVCDVGCPSKGTNGASAFVCLFTALREGFLSDCVRRPQTEAPAACSPSAFAIHVAPSQLCIAMAGPTCIAPACPLLGTGLFLPFLSKVTASRGMHTAHPSAWQVLRDRQSEGSPRGHVQGQPQVLLSHVLAGENPSKAASQGTWRVLGCCWDGADWRAALGSKLGFINRAEGEVSKLAAVSLL